MNPRPCFLADKTIRCSDFSLYLEASRSAWEIQTAGIYKIETAHDLAKNLSGSGDSFPLPVNITPVGLFFLRPLSVLGKTNYSLAFALWGALSIASFVLMTIRLSQSTIIRTKIPIYLALLISIFSETSYMSLGLGQSSLLFNSLLLIPLVPCNTFAIAAATTVLASKPQYLALMIGILIVQRNWRALGLASGLIGLIIAFMTIKLGFSWPFDYLNSLKLVTSTQGSLAFPTGFHDNIIVTFRTTFQDILGSTRATSLSWLLLGSSFLAVIISAKQIGESIAVTLLPLLLILFQPHAYGYELLLIHPAVINTMRYSRNGSFPTTIILVLQLAILNSTTVPKLCWLAVATLTSFLVYHSRQSECAA